MFIKGGPGIFQPQNQKGGSFKAFCFILSTYILVCLIMPPSHCRECCLRTNTNWHSLRIAQHRIDSNYFLLVRCHFRISSQANTYVLKCSKHSYWPCESILFVLRRIASPNVVSIRVSSYWFVSHRCTFVSIRCTFALGFAACLLRLSTLQYDAQRSYCRIGSHMFALVRVSSYWFLSCSHHIIIVLILRHHRTASYCIVSPSCCILSHLTASYQFVFNSCLIRIDSQIIIVSNRSGSAWR